MKSIAHKTPSHRKVKNKSDDSIHVKCGPLSVEGTGSIAHELVDVAKFGIVAAVGVFVIGTCLISKDTSPSKVLDNIF